MPTLHTDRPPAVGEDQFLEDQSPETDEELWTPEVVPVAGPAPFMPEFGSANELVGAAEQLPEESQGGTTQ